MRGTAPRARGWAGRKQLPLDGTTKRKVRLTKRKVRLEERRFRPVGTQIETKKPLGRRKRCRDRLEVTKDGPDFPLGDTKVSLYRSAPSRFETNPPLGRLK